MPYDEKETNRPKLAYLTARDGFIVKRVRPKSVDVETASAALLMSLGLRSSADGFRYFKDSIAYYVGGRRDMLGIYAEIAAKYGEKPENIDRDMRHELRAAQKSGKLYALNRILNRDVVPPKRFMRCNELVSAIAESATSEYFRNEILVSRLENL